MSTKRNETEVSQGVVKTCFVIMPISNQPGYTLGHFNRVYEYIIKPACEKAGFLPIRADDVKSSNVIILDILKRILSSDMAICDISARNPNVLYELGIRQSFDLPVALMRDDITSDIFDVQMTRYTSYDSNLRYDLVLEAIDNLVEAIVETYNNHEQGIEINSLVQLLGREKANVKTSELDSNTRVILDSINAMNENIVQLNKFSHSYNVEQNSNFDIVPVRVKLMDGNDVIVDEYVENEKFGRGRITRIDGNGKEQKLTIMFPSGEKVLLASFAKLTKSKRQMIF